MALQPQTSKVYFKTLSIIHFSLLFGQLLLAAMLYYLAVTNDPIEPNDTINQIFRWLVPIVVVVAYLGGKVYLRKRLEKIQQMGTLIAKMIAYRSTIITRYATMTFSSLAALIGFHLTSNLLLLGIAVFVISILALLRPTKDRAMDDLLLTHEERAEVSNPNAFIAQTDINAN